MSMSTPGAFSESRQFMADLLNAPSAEDVLAATLNHAREQEQLEKDLAIARLTVAEAEMRQFVRGFAAEDAPTTVHLTNTNPTTKEH